MENLKKEENLVEEKNEVDVNPEDIHFEQPEFMSFLVGVRGTTDYQVQTNLNPCTVTDYIEASAGIDVNIILTMLRTGGIKTVESFMKMKEIVMISSIKSMENQYENLGLTKEEYQQLREFFHINEIIETVAEQKKVRREEILGKKKDN